jgi:hypothetical protein
MQISWLLCDSFGDSQANKKITLQNKQRTALGKEMKLECKITSGLSW